MRDLVLKLGAEKWIDFKESKDIVADVKAATGGQGAHAAVVTSSAPGDYTQATESLRSGGTLMCVGLPGTTQLSTSIFFTVFKSLNILGSYVGNRQDAQEALDIATRGEIKVHFAVKPLSELKAVYDGFHKGTIAGRIVMDMIKK